MAKSPEEALAEFVGRLESLPVYRFLRQPEIGMVMVRGRAGGEGQRFNLGEMTVTRCTVKLDCGTVGHGYVAGRRALKCELVALLDALMQRSGPDATNLAGFVDALEKEQIVQRERVSRKTAATKVEFFTLVRER
jgi:alpha-D-ribose 1-methylphosphonate 5-triphosphate synthase subunit PhnG